MRHRFVKQSTPVTGSLALINTYMRSRSNTSQDNTRDDDPLDNACPCVHEIAQNNELNVRVLYTDTAVEGLGFSLSSPFESDQVAQLERYSLIYM